MEEQKRLTCCFTGHRTIDAEHMRPLSTLLDRTIESLIGCGYTVFRTGGARGFDTLAALSVLSKREKYPQLRLHLCLPCRDQAKQWNDWEREAYQYILANANEISYVTESYQRGCMHTRNRRMVEGSDCCVAYCTVEEGGSAYTLQYAKKLELRVINLAGLFKQEEEYVDEI